MYIEIVVHRIVKLPIDTLKIDRSFIMNLPDDKDDIQLVSTIISMAHGLGLDVVAEGIETKQQLDFLIQKECGRGQGYYLFKPLPAKDISNWLKYQSQTTQVSGQ